MKDETHLHFKVLFHFQWWLIAYDSFIQEPQNEHAKLMNLSSIGRSVSSPGSVDSPTTQLSQPQSKYLL